MLSEEDQIAIAIQLSLEPQLRQNFRVRVEGHFYDLIDHGSAFENVPGEGNACAYNCLSKLLEKNGLEIDSYKLKEILTAHDAEFAEPYSMIDLPIFMNFPKIFRVSFQLVVFEKLQNGPLKVLPQFYQIGRYPRHIGKIALIQEKKHYYEMILDD